ncbi:MAG TPA: hypothetical protein PLD80_10095 [Rugosibacter sp.]|nr:hypothetical protein [Rugosibacter sp.]
MRGFSLSQTQHTPELLAFYETISDTNADAHKAMLAELNKPIADTRQNQLRQIKLAMLLGLPSSRIRDTVKSQSLLQEIIQANNLEPTDTALVNLLFEFMTDANRLIKVKSDNKAQQQRIDALQQKNEQLQQKYEALEQKLDALKKIEKTMGDRDLISPANP